MSSERESHYAQTLRPLVIALLLLGGVAPADPVPQFVNLLSAVPTTVSVSSTVANADHLPEHLVDGKLATAWNSKTGELVDAWIGVRLPPDVQVKIIMGLERTTIMLLAYRRRTAAGGWS